MTSFFTSDPHLGHQRICEFTRKDGSPLRPWDDVDEMNEALIERWNAKVGPKDRTFVLGDFVMNRDSLHLAGRLNGEKILILGNHDTLKASEYLEFFSDVKAFHTIKGITLTHIPLHPASLGRAGCNVHGHLHYQSVTLPDSEEIDPRYLCVCVEHTDYTPISLSELKERIVLQGGTHHRVEPNYD